MLSRSAASGLVRALPAHPLPMVAGAFPQCSSPSHCLPPQVAKASTAGRPARRSLVCRAEGEGTSIAKARSLRKMCAHNSICCEFAALTRVLMLSDTATALQVDRSKDQLYFASESALTYLDGTLPGCAYGY